MNKGSRIMKQCDSNLSIQDCRNIYADAGKKVMRLSKDAPVLSVVMPFYRAGFIGFVPFESLIRQVNINFAWEIIVIEECFDNPFQFKRIAEYQEALESVGCCKITYISLKKWLPLGAKWHYLYQNVAPTSKVVCCNSSDIYMDKIRLKKQFDVISSGSYNWYKLNGNIVYDLSIDQHVRFVSPHKKRPDTCCRAMSSELAKKVPLSTIKSSVDGWSYNTLSDYGIKYFEDYGTICDGTININGLNNITNRTQRIKDITPPLRSCCIYLERHIPKEVVKMLRTARKHIEQHNKMKKQNPLKRR